MSTPTAPVIAVLPTYNDGPTVRNVVDAVVPHVDAVVVVDDGSTDNTVARLAGSAAECIHIATNRGKGAALRRGLAHARALGAGAAITLDADGQHPPDNLPAMRRAHAADPGAIVIGARDPLAGTAPPARRAANRVADFFLSWAAGRRLRDTQSGFRVYPAAAIAVATAIAADGFVYESEVLMACVERNFPIRYISIAPVYTGLTRPSHYRPVVDTTRITLHVAVRLLRRGLAPVRLARALRHAPDT